MIGVPIKSSNSIDGWDSVLSILQMPNGVPVATVALNAAKNAGLLAAQIIGTHNETISKAMGDYKLQMESEVMEKVSKLTTNWDNQRYLRNQRIPNNLRYQNNHLYLMLHYNH